MSNNATLAPARSSNTHHAGKSSADVPAVSASESAQGEQISLNTITLFLRPRADRFNERPISRAYEAGFESLPGRHVACLVSQDTGELIATLTPDCNGLVRPVQEFKLCVDPETCAIEYRAGARLVEKTRGYATSIGAYVCDGFGKELGSEGLDAIGCHIDQVLNRRRDEEMAARMIKSSEGEIRRLGYLSFQYAVMKEAGSRKGTYRRVDFDCRPMPYYEGYVQGVEMAEEVIAFYRKHKQSDLEINSVIAAAIVASKEVLPDTAVTRRGQAFGFLDVMAALIRVGTGNINPKWIENKKTRALESQKYSEERTQQEKAEFVARMRAAREAKKTRGAA